MLAVTHHVYGEFLASPHGVVSKDNSGGSKPLLYFLDGMSHRYLLRRGSVQICVTGLVLRNLNKEVGEGLYRCVCKGFRSEDRKKRVRLGGEGAGVWGGHAYILVWVCVESVAVHTKYKFLFSLRCGLLFSGLCVITLSGMLFVTCSRLTTIEPTTTV